MIQTWKFIIFYLSLVPGQGLPTRQTVLFLPLLPPGGHVNIRVDKLWVSVVRVVRPQRFVLHSVRVVGEARRVLEELVAGQVGGLTEGVGREGLRGAGGGIGLVPFSDYFLLSALVTSTED